MKIKVEGTEYEFPAMDSIDMDEAIILERYAGHTMEALDEMEDLPLGAVKGFVIIAIMRARPDAKEKEIAQRVGKIKLSEMQDLLEGDEEIPPSQTPTESGDSDETSGGDGESTSDDSPDNVRPLDSGRPESDTTARSAQERSAS